MAAMHAEASSSSAIHEVCYAPAPLFNSRGDRQKRRKCRKSEPRNLMTVSAHDSLLLKNIHFYCFKIFDKFAKEDCYKYRSAPYWTSTFKSRLLFLAITILFTILLSEQTRPSIALKCYETFNGKTVITDNSSWHYCALVPSTINSRHHIINGTQFGLGPTNDKMIAYDGAFSLADEDYRVLTVCLFERYDFSRYMSTKSQSAVEFQFRCVCNYDLCNSKAKFAPYLAALRKDSFSSSNYPNTYVDELDAEEKISHEI